MSNVLIIDMGTQSMRGIIFDNKGNILAKERIKYPPFVSLEKGYVEQDADVYWDTLSAVCNRLAEGYPELMSSVIAMSVDTFRDSVVMLDKDCKPLRRCIIWSDQRKIDETPIPLLQRVCFKVANVERSIAAVRQKIKSRWIKQHEPQIWEKTDKAVFISSYIIYKLTGRLVDSYASQLGMLPFNNQKKRWLKRNELLFPLYETTLDRTIPLVAPGEVLGTVSEEVSRLTGIPQGLRVIASGSDKGCETLGVGCLEKNVASVSFGTSSTVQFCTKDFFEPEPFMPAYPAVLKDYYNPEVQIYRGYWMISWFKANFARELEPIAEQSGKTVEDILNEEIVSVPAGCDGLLLQPFWQGGLTNSEARGAIIGFSDFHTRAHVYRAIIEGVDFALREGLERMERRGKQKIEYISVSGGGSQSDVICQIAADVFNKPVRRVQTYETSGLGAAIVTFTACGEFSDEHQAVREMVHFTNTFTPNPQNVKIYDHIFNDIYMKLYGKLQSFYFDMFKRSKH